MTEFATLPPLTSRGSWSPNAASSFSARRARRAASSLLEAERRELLVGQFEEDIDQRVAEADEVEFFHCSVAVSGEIFCTGFERADDLHNAGHLRNGTVPPMSSG